jgi:two-component system response regulator WspF
MPADYPHPIVIVQHVDKQFSASFADWLNQQTVLNVRIAKNSDSFEPGTVLVAGTSDHLTLANDNRVYYTENPKEYVYRPSVDVFFNSIAERWKGKVLGVLLTGMGRDGANGLLALRNHGAHTISQDETSCAVYGMPKAAVDIKASCAVETVDQIIDSILKFGDKTRQMVKSA